MATVIALALLFFISGCTDTSTIEGSIGSSGPGQVSASMSWDASNADDGTTNVSSWTEESSRYRWGVSYGETAGGYRVQCFTTGGGCTTDSYIWKKFAWTDFGVPSGATVTTVGDTGGNTTLRYSTDTLGGTTVTIGPVHIYDSTNTAFLGTLMTTDTETSDTGTFVTLDTGNQINLSDDAADEFVIRIHGKIVVGALALGSAYLFLDDFTFPIEYTTP